MLTQRRDAPAAAAVRARMLVVGALPDLYAGESRVTRVCNIMVRQWRAVAAWLAHSYRGDTEALPPHGGWEELPKFNAACEIA